MAAGRNDHKLGDFKQWKFSFSQSWRLEGGEQGVTMATHPQEALGESVACFLQFLEAAPLSLCSVTTLSPFTSLLEGGSCLHVGPTQLIPDNLLTSEILTKSHPLPWKVIITGFGDWDVDTSLWGLLSNPLQFQNL